MKSNLERIYRNRDNFDILNSSRYLFSSNPFYQVNEFIVKIDRSLNKNYLLNLKDLGITENKNNEYISNYDYNHNIVSSKEAKSDVFTLLHVASNDRNRKYTGIINEEGVGYGLNSGLTDYYTNLINSKNYSYPVEVIIAKTIDKICHKDLATSYFENNVNILLNDSGVDRNLLNELLLLVDKYHENYIELIRLYKDKFEKERYYHNEVYGKLLKERNLGLQKIYDKIYDLEYNSYVLVDDIYWLLIDIIDFSKTTDSFKKLVIETLNSDLSSLFKLEQFSYLNNLSNYLKKDSSSVKIMRLIK